MGSGTDVTMESAHVMLVKGLSGCAERGPDYHGRVAELRGGERAPAFQLPDQDGQLVSTKDLGGQRTLLYFFPKADTSG